MKLKVFKMLAFFMKYSRWLVVGAVMAGLVAGSSSAVLMMLINARVAGAIEPSSGSVIKFVVLAALVLISTTSSGIISNLLAQRTSAQLRMYLCQSILNAPLKSIENAGANRVMTSLTQDITVVIAALLRVPGLFINCAIVIGGMAYLGWLSMPMLLVLIGFVIVAVVSYIVPQKTANRYIVLARDEYGKMVGHFRSIILGGKELRLHGPRRRAFFSSVFEPTAVTLKRYSLLGDGMYVLLNSWSNTLYFVIIGMILFGLPALMGDVSLRVLTAYALTVLYISGPIQALVSIIPAFSQANISLRKLEELGVTLTTATIVVDPNRLEAAPNDDWELLELSGVTHTYYREHESGNFVLGPMDLTFRPGELTFVVGGNGSGKTTLAKLLCGLYLPETGEVKLNGRRITEQDFEDYRQYFSVVFTEFHVFEQLLGFEHIDLDERAREYLEELQLDTKVTVKDGKLSTTELSYGQRKRLALLTAYLEDRPIYIFDEWAADQDPHFKSVFYNSILPSLKAKGKCVIVISHDDRYYYVADRIVKLDYGRIVLDEYQVALPAGTAPGAVTDHILSAFPALSVFRPQSTPASLIPEKVEKNGHPTSKVTTVDGANTHKDVVTEKFSVPEATVIRDRKKTVVVPLSFVLMALLAVLAIALQRPPIAVNASAPPDQFSSARAMTHLNVIAQQPHPIGSAGQRNVELYITRVLAENGLVPEIQKDVVVKDGTRANVVASVRNIVVRLSGTTPNRKAVMLVAHYDSVANSPGASDDGAGVVTLLETIRALKARPPLQNDLIFLFTDGEEPGLLGAKAFADNHPWASDVGLVLNFEARGSGGPVYMFETSEGNGKLIGEFGNVVPHPFASSLMYTIYKLLPNDTDFTIFRRKGLPGFNFAYIGGANRYHSFHDSLQTVDERSIQHHGSYALSLTSHFGNLNLDNLRTTNAIYFDLLGMTFFSYPQSWAIPLAVLLVLLFAVTVFLGLRNKALTPGRAALGFVLWLVSTAVAVAAATGLWKALTLWHPYYTSRSNATLYAACLLSLAFCIAISLYLLFSRWTGWNNLTVGALGGWLVITVVSSIMLPGASYLFAWPLLFSLVALAVTFLYAGRESWPVLATILAAPIPGVLLIAATIYSVFQGVALGLPAALVLPEVMLLALFLPYLKRTAPYLGYLAAVTLLATLTFLILGNVMPVYDVSNPRTDSVVYNVDADTGETTWLSNDGRADQWTAQFFAAGNSRPLTSPAPRLNLQDELKVLDDKTTEQGRSIHLRLSSPRQARIFSLYADPDAQITGAIVNGKRLNSTSAPTGRGWELSYLGVPPEGIDLVVETKSTGNVKLKFGSYSDGLPDLPTGPVSPRPPQLMPAINSDVTHVVKTYDLGGPGASQR
jgi:putative ATP-binding cassette transporter